MRLWGERVETLDVVLDIVGLFIVLAGVGLLISGIAAGWSFWILLFGVLALAAGFSMLGPEIKRFRKARRKTQG
jgi:hypothetical protein